KGVLSKRQTINGQGQELVTTELNPHHPLVQRALPGAAVSVGAPVIDELDDTFEDDRPLPMGVSVPANAARVPVTSLPIDPEEDELDADDQARVLAASAHFRNEQQRLAARESGRYQRRFSHDSQPTWRRPEGGR
ncbi:MAG: hypothetical protein M3121_07410, partial [Chloroflexota bacterium]|nr:hypothetical protein [Chloroflexota bacterium]